jgi:hypothetical protein
MVAALVVCAVSDVGWARENAADVSVALEGARVVVRKRGHLVAIRAGERTSSARDWVAAQLEGSGQVDLVWEATDPATLETTRGTIHVAPSDEGPRISSASLPAPAVVASHRDRLHECRAHEEGGGFAVVCRVAGGARQLAIVNLTGEGPEAALERPGVLRFDVPVSEGRAEARLMGYLDGVTAVVVRAEASWARGEDRPTFALAGAARAQLAVPRLSRVIHPDFKF